MYFEVEVPIFCCERSISFVARGVYQLEPEESFGDRGAYLMGPEVHIFCRQRSISSRARGANLFEPEVHIF